MQDLFLEMPEIWSSPFTIDEVEEFHLSFFSGQETEDKHLKPWYLPS